MSTPSSRSASPQKDDKSGASTPSSRHPSPSPASNKRRMLSDSESDTEKKEKTGGSSKLIDDSDNESLKSERSAPAAAPSTKHLFGDDDLSSSDDEIRIKADRKKRASDDEEREGDDDDELHGIVMANPDDEEPEEEKEMVLNNEASLPRIRLNLGSEPYFVKMPNFLSVSTHPFDPDFYEEDEYDDQVKLDDEGRNRLKLRVENTIRWRRSVDENNEEIRESNAKFVKWSDGTMSLYLGNEIFEVTMMPLNASNLPYVYAQQMGGMAAQSQLQKRITFRPHSTDSQTHRKVTLNMADRSRKSGQVKVMDDVGVNPEIQRREAARKEEEALRQHIRRTQMVRNTFRPRRPFGAGGYSDDEEGMSAPRRSKGKRKEAPLIGASSDESDASGHGKKSGSDSDSDEEYRKRKQQQKKTIVTSDEESS